jgi:hypothetical protein
MTTSSFTQDVCRRPLTYVLCKKGYVYFGGRCYYKFAAVSDAHLQSPLSSSQFSCASIPGAPPGIEFLVSASYDLRVFLQRIFVLVARTVPGWPFRYPVPNTATTNAITTNGCYCVDFLPGIVTNTSSASFTGARDNDVGTTSLCICSDPAFPICSYPVANYEVKDRYISKSIRTVRVLRDGQQGPPGIGQYAKCLCFPGWFGSRCNLPGCPIDSAFPLHLAQVSSDPRTNFYLACAAGNTGQCRANVPTTCVCDGHHGPAASLLPNSPLFYASTFPCACPAGSAPDQTAGAFVVNNIRFPPGTLALNVPCGGIDRGACNVDPFTNFGTCTCTSYFDPYLNKSTPLNAGEACTCPLPKVPAAGYANQAPQVVAKPCNARGTCCPLATPSQMSPIGNGGHGAQACFSLSGIPLDGYVHISPSSSPSPSPFPSVLICAFGGSPPDGPTGGLLRRGGIAARTFQNSSLLPSLPFCKSPWTLGRRGVKVPKFLEFSDFCFRDFSGP